MHTSLSKKLLAGLLSLVMVLSLVAPSMGTQAASKYTLTNKTSVKADVTYKYQLKGVSKNQYVKVTRNVSGETVKYNKKAVSKTTKINGTGKTLNLYVTYGDKVANYTGKFTAKVYSKKTNKVVKTLTEKATVKVTPLEVNKVEVASTNGKYVVAYFNKALETLKAGDVTIRQKDNDELKGIESVELSSDGKTATIALVGSEEANWNNSFIIANKWYTFTVSQKGATATTEFSMDDCWANCVVTDVDAVKGMIEFDGDGDFLYVPSTITVDYEEILGTTQTVWFNDDDVITKLVSVDKKAPIYGGFKAYSDGKKAYLLDLVTGEKYYTQDTEVNGTSTRATHRIEKNADGKNSVRFYYGVGAIDNESLISYGKIVLNNNGTIKTIVTEEKWNDMVHVESVDKNFVLTAGGVKKYNFANYTLVKEGKTVDVASLQAGDIVLFNTASRFGEVYTNKVTGKITASYDKEFKFEGKKYAYNDTTCYDFNVRYAVKGYGVLELDREAADSFIASEKEFTVFFDRKGNPVFVEGTQAKVPTSTIDLALMVAAKDWNQGLNNYVQYRGYNAESKKIETYNVDITDITTVIDENGDKYTVGGYVPYAKGNPNYEKYIITGITVAADGGVTVENVDATTMAANTDVTINAADGVITKAELGDLVSLIKDDTTNKIIGIDYTAPKKTLQTAITAGMNKVNVGGKEYEIPGSALIYVLGANKVAAGHASGTHDSCGTAWAATPMTTAKAVKYSEFKGVFAANPKAALTSAHVYITAGKVTAIVIDEELLADPANTTTIKGVVADVNTRGNFANTIDVAYGYGEDAVKTYDVYSKKIVAGTFKIGDIVNVTLESDGKTVRSVAAAAKATDTIKINSAPTSKVLPTVGGGLKTSSTSTVTLAKVVVNGTTRSLELVENLAGFFDGTVKAENEITYSAYANGSDTVDVIVVTKMDNTNVVAPTPAASAIAASASGTYDDTATSMNGKVIASDVTKIKFTPDADKLLKVAKLYVNGIDSGVTNTGAEFDSFTLHDGDRLLIKLYYEDGTDEVITGYTVEARKATKVTGTPVAAVNVATNATIAVSDTVAITGLTVKDQFGKDMTDATGTVSVSENETTASTVTYAASTLTLTIKTAQTAATVTYTVKFGDQTYTIVLTKAALLNGNTSAGMSFNY